MSFGTLLLYRGTETEQAAISLPLYTDSKRPAVEDFVLRDFPYSGRFLQPPVCDENSLRIFINGIELKTAYNPQSGSLSILEEGSEERWAKPFLNCYGYAQLTVCFSVDGTERRLYSDNFQVLRKYREHSAAIMRMLDYVYHNDHGYLFGGKLPARNLAGMRQRGDKTIESRLLLLHNTARVFEISYPYFKANSRFKTVQTQRVDNFEKLRHVSANTIQFICRHPEELVRVNSPRGIKAGGHTYQPRRTLITNNAPSYDIYENRVIIGFLSAVLEAIRGIQAELNSLKQEEGIYIFPDEVNFSGTLLILNTALEDLSKLESRFLVLLNEYGAILGIEGSRVLAPPKPTPLFMAIPQYKQAYDCMLAWFTMGPVSMEEKNHLLSFIGLSDLYEAYVLLKIIGHFTAGGWHMEHRGQITYTLPENCLHENTRYHNIFVFRRGNIRVTLYYQPVIYHYQGCPEDDFGLSLRRDWGDDNSIYTPDYLLKIQKTADEGLAGSAKYVFLDAKFSTSGTVKRYEVKDLARKYLFAISPQNPDDEVLGLLIINGQLIRNKEGAPRDGDKLIDIRRTRENFHFADILTLTEESMDNEEHHKALLEAALQKYFT